MAQLPNWPRVYGEIPQALARAYQRIGSEAQETFRGRARAAGLVRRGRLVKSIGYKVRRDTLTVRAAAGYASLLNKGRAGSKTVTVSGRRRKDGSRGKPFTRTYRSFAGRGFMRRSIALEILRRNEVLFIREIQAAAGFR